MKQRVAIARALVSEPDILLMDELFSSLDALTREAAQEFLLQVRRSRPMTIILVTHSIEEAVYLAGTVFVMGGRNPGTIRKRFDIPENRMEGRFADGTVDFRSSPRYSVRSLRATRFDLAIWVVVPATLPDLLTSLRVSLGTAIAVLFLAETFATQTGLGLGLFVLVDGVERLVCPWRPERI